MTDATHRLKDELAALPIEDRAFLAQFLFQTLPLTTDDGWVEAWTDELFRRRQSIESGEDQGVPAEDVFQRLREKYG